MRETGSIMRETGSMERRKRRKFTAEYKAEVVRLVRTSGKGIGQVARELDLTETAVRAWVKQAAIDEKRDPQGPLTSEERAENARLRRELKTVTMERDFLRKAAAFFARSGK
jgi:transposase